MPVSELLKALLMLEFFLFHLQTDVLLLSLVILLLLNICIIIFFDLLIDFLIFIRDINLLLPEPLSDLL